MKEAPYKISIEVSDIKSRSIKAYLSWRWSAARFTTALVLDQYIDIDTQNKPYRK